MNSNDHHEKLSEEFISREDLHAQQTRGKMQDTVGHAKGRKIGGNVIDLSELGEGRYDLQKIKNNYFQRMSKNGPSQNVF